MNSYWSQYKHFFFSVQNSTLKKGFFDNFFCPIKIYFCLFEQLKLKRKHLENHNKYYIIFNIHASTH